MWLFLSRRLRTWVLLTFAAPLAAKALQAAGNALADRNGPTSLSRALCKGGEFLDTRRAQARRRPRRS